ncbi:NAD(P)H-dependent oxidoreductase [Butyrivibrio sp. DSM 10294]|uniref:NAD(P)H-dependent oxidoreductase n=1 Tax=Butyrivibrio sp. DSM 10294 TaxID=2972457 RepID=UPI00234F6CB3|nr:NAD(P)H-dependent oxidoreductase [Butyrivibrio sp. DSM 10294]MDC7293831.1 NAD(P)H-dependent oxidoreductase [Butyrivibrio sp. DSM 10294]
MILFVDACVRKDSRTKRLAEALLEKLGENVARVSLEDISFGVTDETYLKKRDDLIAKGAFEDDMFALARQFAEADAIVIAAPYWDLSFPAMLKQYIEAINVLGITFEYTPEGFPKGLCKANKLYYVMTAGGNYVPEEFGFGYIKALAQNFYGIENVELIKATGLDIIGADSETIINETINDLK